MPALEKLNVAIIGTGIAGLGAGYRLHQRCNLTFFEKNDYAGGHSNTAIITTTNAQKVSVDTGFMVFNKVTYPLLTRLFEDLRVPIKTTDMSFSVQHKSLNLEYAGASWSRLFGQKRNLVNARFWKMLLQLDRFNKEAIAALNDATYDGFSLAEYVRARGYGEDFQNFYLIPMSSAVWSTPPEKMLAFPAKSLLRFFHNHGFLGMTTQHQWWTVEGGSRKYVAALLEHLGAELVLCKPVQNVVRQANDVLVVTADGAASSFDKVIIASHADHALQMLEAPERSEQETLSAFQYQPNVATLHTDSAVMPHAKGCWSSWNYILDKSTVPGKVTASTHYWMNALQNVSQTQNYFVSINGEHLIDSSKTLKVFNYEHPLFDVAALDAQLRLPQLNQRSPQQRVYFCGSYFRYGFHEDALMAGVAAADALLHGLVPA